MVGKCPNLEPYPTPLKREGVSGLKRKTCVKICLLFHAFFVLESYFFSEIVWPKSLLLPNREAGRDNQRGSESANICAASFPSTTSLHPWGHAHWVKCCTNGLRLISTGFRIEPCEPVQVRTLSGSLKLSHLRQTLSPPSSRGKS